MPWVCGFGVCWVRRGVLVHVPCRWHLVNGWGLDPGFYPGLDYMSCRWHWWVVHVLLWLGWRVRCAVGTGGGNCVVSLEL